MKLLKILGILLDEKNKSEETHTHTHARTHTVLSDYFRLLSDAHEYNTRQYISIYAVPMKTD